jgi:hypothetical protein
MTQREWSIADHQPNHAIDRACASCPVAAECQTGEQAEQEPLLWGDDKFAPHERPQNHEPVAWAISHSLGLEFGSKYPMQETKEAAEQMARQHMGAVVVTPLYAAPVNQNRIPDATKMVQCPANWSDKTVQIMALQRIGGYWYDGPVRNQWIADTCYEMAKMIGGAVHVQPVKQEPLPTNLGGLPANPAEQEPVIPSFLRRPGSFGHE